MNYLYLLLDLGTISIPLIYSFHKKLRFDLTWKAFWPACIISAIIFIAWDIAYTDWGVWGFTPKYLSGFYLGNLPIEEVLFFICIPYACVYTYHCLNVLIKKETIKNIEPFISLMLIIVLSIVGLLALPRLYTSVTFFSLAGFISFLKYILKVNWLHRFYFAYAILLIPFAIVNGVLTGTGIEDQVVWYDDTQNLGFRLGTIPVEDIFYGMLLILLNVAFYHFFMNKFKLEKQN